MDTILIIYLPVAGTELQELPITGLCDFLVVQHAEHCHFELNKSLGHQKLAVPACADILDEAERLFDILPLLPIYQGLLGDHTVVEVCNLKHKFDN